jgi:hypothetical protein
MGANVKNHQNLVWQYLTLHRKLSGVSLSYLKLLQDAEYRQQALLASQQQGDPTLDQLAQAAHAWLEDRQNRIRTPLSRQVAEQAPTETAEVEKAPAPEPVALGTDHLHEAPPPAPQAAHFDGGPRRVMGAVTLLGVALAGVAAMAFLGGSWVGNDGAKTAEAQSGNTPQLVAQADDDTRLVHVRDAIGSSQTWDADHVYQLETPVFVEAGVVLTIEAGTHIQGLNGAALIVTKDAKLYARGRRTAPIVFTSAKAPGERARGDWGGLVMLGNAPINQGSARVEGVDEHDPRGLFGGNLEGDNCGMLEYVRIEFSGYEVFTDNELNGLTLGGCGNKTIVRNVQVHRSLDDGIEIFGGDVDLRNIVITGAKDDGFDWDMGWHGRVQFLVVQQYPDVGDNGFEADNWKGDNDALPRSAPTFYNVTLVGGLNAQKAQRGMTLRRGTAGVFRNFIITGFDKEAIDVRDTRTAALATAGELELDHSLFYEIGPDDHQYFGAEPRGTEADDDDGFNEHVFFTRPEYHNRFDQAPLLSEDVFHESKPNFTPLPLSPATDGATLPPEEEFWDQGARYIGAVKPGTNRSWVAGWTDYPKS